MEATGATVDVRELETKVKDMYRHVAQEPDGKYHFELGRALAEHLGYPGEVLDRIPDGAIESFAGVGYFFDLAEPERRRARDRPRQRLGDGCLLRSRSRRPGWRCHWRRLHG